MGFSPAQVNVRFGRRVSAAKAFLNPVRNVRPNLRILTHTQATGIVIDPFTLHTEGVRFRANGRNWVANVTKEVILSAGAINSPLLLMLSGVGPASHLESLGIPVLQDLPVGYNLQDHVSMAALTFLANESVTLIEPRVVSNFRNTFDYILRGTGPFTIPGGAEAIAFIDTRSC